MTQSEKTNQVPADDPTNKGLQTAENTHCSRPPTSEILTITKQRGGTRQQGQRRRNGAPNCFPGFPRVFAPGIPPAALEGSISHEEAGVDDRSLESRERVGFG